MKVRFAHSLAAVALLASTAAHGAVLPADAKSEATPAAPRSFAPDASWTWMADNEAAVRPLRHQPGKGERDERETRAVPEPGVLALLVLPALALAATARRRRG